MIKRIKRLRRVQICTLFNFLRKNQLETNILDITSFLERTSYMFTNFIITIKEGIMLDPMQLLIYAPLFVFMGFASYIDSHELRIPDRLNLCMFFLRLLVIPIFPIEVTHILGGILGGLFILIPAMIILKPMGGDIKFATVLGLWIGDVSIFIVMVISAITFILYAGLIKRLDRKKSLAFAPFMSASCVLVFIIGLILYYIN